MGGGGATQIDIQIQWCAGVGLTLPLGGMRVLFGLFNLQEPSTTIHSHNSLIRVVHTAGMPSVPVLSVQRYLSGSGHEWGGLHTEITNNHASNSLKVLYLDMIPWFCRIYIHTLQVESGEFKSSLKLFFPC